MMDDLQCLLAQTFANVFLSLGMDILRFTTVDHHGKPGASHIAENMLLRLTDTRPAFTTLAVAP